MAWIRSIERADGCLEAVLQRLAHGLAHQHVIGGHTALPRVEKASPGNPPGAHLHIGIVEHDAGAFPPQLQGHRDQLLGRGLHHQATDAGAAGEHHVIKGLAQQGLACFHTPQLHLHHLRAEVAGDGLCQELRHCRGLFGGLQHRRVTSG